MKHINIGEAELEIMKVVRQSEKPLRKRAGSAQRLPHFLQGLLKKAHCLPKDGARHGITHRF